MIFPPSTKYQCIHVRWYTQIPKCQYQYHLPRKSRVPQNWILPAVPTPALPDACSPLASCRSSCATKTKNPPPFAGAKISHRELIPNLTAGTRTLTLTPHPSPLTAPRPASLIWQEAGPRYEGTRVLIYVPVRTRAFSASAIAGLGKCGAGRDLAAWFHRVRYGTYAATKSARRVGHVKVSMQGEGWGKRGRARS
jgi:hypothetical protein